MRLFTEQEVFLMTREEWMAAWIDLIIMSLLLTGSGGSPSCRERYTVAALMDFQARMAGLKARKDAYKAVTGLLETFIQRELA